MIREIPVNNMGIFSNYEIDVPTSCPICGVAFDPKLISATIAEGVHTMSNNLTVTFQCTNCDHFFHIDRNEDGPDHIFPVIAKLDLLNDITHAYPVFAEIYRQSLQAQAENLYHIAGMGYRKAVEQLVKDYLTRKFPEKSDAIKSESLGDSIKRITLPSIQALAKASTWFRPDCPRSDEPAAIRPEISDMPYRIRFCTGSLNTIHLYNRNSFNSKNHIG